MRAELKCLPKPTFAELIITPFLTAVYGSSAYLLGADSPYSAAASFKDAFKGKLVVHGEYTAQVEPCFFVPRYMRTGADQGAKLVAALESTPVAPDAAITYSHGSYTLEKMDASFLPAALKPS